MSAEFSFWLSDGLCSWYFGHRSPRLCDRMKIGPHTNTKTTAPDSPSMFTHKPKLHNSHKALSRVVRSLGVKIQPCFYSTCELPFCYRLLQRKPKSRQRGRRGGREREERAGQARSNMLGRGLGFLLEGRGGGAGKMAKTNPPNLGSRMGLVLGIFEGTRGCRTMVGWGCFVGLVVGGGGWWWWGGGWGGVGGVVVVGVFVGVGGWWWWCGGGGGGWWCGAGGGGLVVGGWVVGFGGGWVEGWVGW